MDLVIGWVACVGGWLLFAGPVFQAAVELREEELERAVIERAASDVERPAVVSPWWWLLPPVFYVLNRRRRRRLRDRTFAQLAPRERTAFVSFMDKAHGWLTVALGALCIAIKETWELTDGRLEWSVWSFLLLCLLGFLLAVGNTAAQVGRGQARLHEPVEAPGPTR